jgi:hypothetical protein
VEDLEVLEVATTVAGAFAALVLFVVIGMALLEAIDHP